MFGNGVKSFMVAGSTVLLVASVSAAQAPSPVARLNQIAYDITHNYGGDPTAEFKEACQLIGFGIWKDGPDFTPQTNNSPIHLAVTEGEIRDYSQMFRQNHSVKLSDMLSAYDDMVNKMGAKVSISTNVMSFLGDTGWSNNMPTFYLQTFLRALNSNHMMSTGSSFTADSQLDPLQSLLLMRVISEDIGTPIRKHLKAKKPFSLASAELANESTYGSLPFPINPQQSGSAPAQIPGWAEDLYVGTIGQIYGAIDSWEGQSGSAGLNFLSSLSYFNGAMSLIKFISAYVKLDGDVSMTPGAPLVRTLDTSEQGALATLKATFKIKGDATSETMADLRKYLALIGGMDLGQPREAPLKGVETEWLIGQSTKYATKQVIETQRGKSVNLSKVVTDDNGTASVPIAGKPQFHEIDKNTAQQIQKHVVIQVTPQLASNDVLSDPINIALGIRSGPIGMLGVVQSFIQHMKWQGTVKYDLIVTDFVPGDVFGTLTVDLNATYSDPNISAGSNQSTISRSLKIEGAKLKVFGGGVPNVPNIDPSVLSQLSDAQKKQVADALAKAQSPYGGASSVLRYMVSGDVGSWSMKINDTSYQTILANHIGEATHGVSSTQSDANGEVQGDYGDGTAPYPSFTMEVHEKDGYVLLGVDASCSVSSHFKHSDADQPSQDQDRTDTQLKTLISDVEIDPSAMSGGGLKIPLKANGHADQGIGGAITVPCKFHGQPANLIISFSLVGKKK